MATALQDARPPLPDDRAHGNSIRYKNKLEGPMIYDKYNKKTFLFTHNCICFCIAFFYLIYFYV